VVRLGRDPQRLGEALRAGGDDHELLQVDRVVGVDAAVDHVEHRHRQGPRVLAAEVAEQGHALIGSRGLRGRKRDAEDRVRAEPSLVGRPVELDQHTVEASLILHVEPLDGVRDLSVDIGDRLGDALAVPRGPAVAQLDRLVNTGRGTGGDDRPPERAGDHLDLDGRIPAGVQHLTGLNLGDHARSFAWS